MFFFFCEIVYKDDMTMEHIHFAVPSLFSGVIEDC